MNFDCTYLGATVSSKVESLDFHTLGSVVLSFGWLSNKILKLLLEENFLIVKLNCKQAIFDAQLPEYFSRKIKSCDNTNDLISVLRFSAYWNWIDIRLMETMAVLSTKAIDMLRQYKDYLKPQNLLNHLSSIPPIPEDIKIYYKVLKIKTQKSINFTIEEFFTYRDILESEILGLKVGVIILKHIDNKSFEIDWLIPIEKCLHAFESAKRSTKDFNQISIYFVHIESYDVVFSETIHQVCY